MFNVKIIPTFKATRDAINLGSDIMSDKVKNLRDRYEQDAPVREADNAIYAASIDDKVHTRVTDFHINRPKFTDDQRKLVADFLANK